MLLGCAAAYIAKYGSFCDITTSNQNYAKYHNYVTPFEMVELRALVVYLFPARIHYRFLEAFLCLCLEVWAY